MVDRVLLAEGREAEVFLLPDGSVLKLLRDPAYEGRVHREAAALEALRAGGHDAAAVLGIVHVDGRPGLVLERIEGDDLMAILGRRPLSVLTAGRAMGVAHAAMHECVAPAGLPDLNDELRARIEEAPPLPDDLRAGALAVLADMPRGDRLCHGDLHIGNMMGSYDQPVIIDWGNASRGDPVADVARTELLHRLGDPPPGAPVLIRVFASVGRRALVARYLATYRLARPIDQHALERWEIVRAAARLAEPIPSEEPRLLRFLRKRLPATG